MSSQCSIFSAYPWIQKIPGAGYLFQWDVAHKVLTDVSDMMEENILKHKDTLDVNEPRDYIDMMLIEIESTKDSSSSFYGQKGLDSLKAGSIFFRRME